VQAGFSLVELVIVMVVMGVFFASFGVFFNNYLRAYTDYQRDGTNFTQIATQSERIANVLRGLTDIVSANGDDIVAYAYFSPGDTFTSLVHYYYNASKRSIIVEVTPMTANPPTGTVITASKDTYTVVENYNKKAGTTLFQYFNAGGNVMALPVTDQHTIVDIQVNLVADTAQTSKGQELDVKVSLRNRKVNL
jgi:prepilin-type N-terminal cleavage/methylation domain-containing protein